MGAKSLLVLDTSALSIPSKKLTTPYPDVQLVFFYFSVDWEKRCGRVLLWLSNLCIAYKEVAPAKDVQNGSDSGDC